jgi:stearoyl-CoA desaturase (Delta-9 desaturase)
MTELLNALQKFGRALVSWFDTSTAQQADSSYRIEWLRMLPYIGVHVMCLGVIWVGVSTTAVIAAIAMYALRMVAITGFYHRYFSHKAFRTSRVVQFVFAALGSSAVQRGPLWWAAHHRHHHSHSDQPDDSHSPVHEGFWWSHSGWFMTRKNFPTRFELVPDLAKFRELRFLDRFDVLMPVVLAVALFYFGKLLNYLAPQLGTSGPQMLIWGFFVSTVALYHGTFTINSLAHVFGKRRYATRDQSRNNWLLAIITFGEGWHNNHHHFPGSVRQGFYWWEIDITYYVLRSLSMLGLIWDLKTVPARIRDARQEKA